MKYLFKVIYLFSIIILLCTNVFAKSIKTEQDRIETIRLLKIIDDTENLNYTVSRKEFAKMLVKCTSDKDKYSSDDYDNYIKKACENGLMFRYINGDFKPEEKVTYSDLTRGCLALLGYTNSDFTGGQVEFRNRKFESLGLNENIDKKETDFIFKIDVINALYNTLKENKKDSKDSYVLSIFDKLKKDSDGEFNNYELIDFKIDDPKLVKNSEYTFPNNMSEYKVYLNGVLSDKDAVRDDLSNYGYMLYTIDNTRKIFYAYTERDDINSTVALKKGYVNNILYKTDNMITPYRVIINDNKYDLDSEECRFLFSSQGTIRMDDEIIFLLNKVNDIEVVTENELSSNMIYENGTYVTYDSVNNRKLYYENSTGRWFYYIEREDEEGNLYNGKKQYYNGSWHSRGYDPEAISGTIILAKKVGEQ